MQVLGGCEQGTRGNAGSRPLAPSSELGLQFANALGLLRGQILLLRRILSEVKKLVFVGPRGVEVLD